MSNSKSDAGGSVDRSRSYRRTLLDTYLPPDAGIEQRKDTPSARKQRKLPSELGRKAIVDRAV